MNEKIEKLASSMKYLKLEKIMNTNSLDKIVKVLKENLQVVISEREEILREDAKLYYDFYETLYFVIKEEMSYNLKSELLQDLNGTEDYAIINNFIKSDMEDLLSKGDLNREEEQNLYFKYNECNNNNYFVNEENILMIVYLKNRDLVSNTIKEHYKKSVDDIKFNSELFTQIYDNLIQNKKDYVYDISETKEEKKKIKSDLSLRFSALALSIVILAGGAKLGFRFSKKNTTIVDYPTTVNEIVVTGDGKVLDDFHREYLSDLIPEEELYILSDYSMQFYDEEKTFRYKIDYELPYTPGTPLEDYISLETKTLEPITKKPEKYWVVAYPWKSSENYIREISVYTQDLDKPDVKENLESRYGLDVAILSLISLLAIWVPYLPLDDIKAIKELTTKRKKNEEDYQRIVTDLGSMLEKLEEANIATQETKDLYSKILELAKVVDLNLNIDSKAVIEQDNTLKLEKIKREINSIL